MYLALCAAAAFGSASAYADCPAGTVFSAFNGRGICAYAGEGARAAVICFATRGACPSGFSLNHKNSDPTRSYCCPVAIGNPSVESCKARCSPLLTSVQPHAEAVRVYNNCMTGCGDPGGEITCPSGRTVPVGTPCN
jgi:hypothetical protein